MPRLHFVKKARRPLPQHGIKVGDSYYWAGFKQGRGGYKRYWKERPRPSQLQSSEYMQAAMEKQENLEEEANNAKTKEDLETFRDSLTSVAEEYRDLGQEQQDKYDNMPEGLQQGDTGQLLEQRREACDSLADELEAAASELEGFELAGEGEEETEEESEPSDVEETEEEQVQAAVNEAMSGISWSFE